MAESRMPILSALKLGDVSMNAARGPGRMLQAVGALALVGPWAITANLVIGMSRREKVVALSILGAHSAIAAGLLVWASRRARNKALDFWIATGMFAITLLVVVAFAASRIDHFEVMPLVDARALLRLVTVHFAAINIASLRPEKAWVLTIVTIIPVIVAHPAMALSSASSWDSRQGTDGWLQYLVTVAVVGATVATTLLSSYSSRAASRAAEDTLSQLEEQTARCQGLLETAMPPIIAKELLAGTSDEALAASLDSVAIAFITLSDFDAVTARLPPKQLMQWLNSVYQALDGLLDCYEGSVTKIETVGSTYLVASGAPTPLSPDLLEAYGGSHEAALGRFCLDVLSLLDHGLPPSIGRVTAKIGLHSGPVTTGLIGATRRYYRLFGDTVNVSSRMMSTGRSGLVHVSEQCVRGLLGLAQESPVPKLAPLMPSDDCLAVVYRGLTAVKGKGDLPTYFLQRADVGTALPPDQARTRDPDMMIAELRGDNSSNTFSRRFSASVAASTGAPHDSDAAAPSAAYVIRSDQQSWHANADSELGVNASPIGTPSRMATSEQDAEGDEAVAAATIRVGAEVSAATAAQRVASQGLAIDSMTPPDSSSQEFDVPALPESSPGISAVERICRRAAELSEAVRSVPYEDCSASPGAGRALADYFSSTQAARVSPEQEISRTGARRASLGNAATSAALQRRASACVNPTPPFATTRSDEVIKVGLSAFDASVTSNRGSGTVPQEAAAPFAIPRRLSLIARHATSNVTCQQPACRGSVVSDTDRIVCASAVPTLASSVSVFPAYAIGGTRSGQASSAGPAESREAKSATEKTRQLIRDPTSGQRDSCVAVDGDESASRPVRVSFVMDNVPRGPEKEQECTTTQPGPAQDIVLAVGSPSRKMRRTGSMSAGAAIAGATTPSSASWLHRMFDSVSQLWSGFEDDDTELAAQRALFLHVLTTTASVYPLWIMSWVVVVAGYATLSVNTVNAIRCVGFTLLPLGLFFALAITARIMCWKYGVSVRWSPTAMRVALWSLTCIHVCILGLILWVASGPETVALLVPAASAAGSEPTTSLDSTSQGPFEGQLLTAVVAIAYVQHVAHSRLPFLHTCMFAAATLMVSLCLVVPRLVLQVTGGALPSSVIGSSVFAIFLGLAGNALTIIVSAFVWEGRCRTQLLSTSATSAARAAATSLLNNLMPPSIVADMVAGREVRPALARNVVILHADIVGFTALSATLPPAQLMVHLNSIFSGFDALVDGLCLWKLETVGDAYIVAAGLFDDTDPDDRSLAASTAAATSLSAAGAGTMRASRKPARVRANVDAALSLALSMQDQLESFRAESGLSIQMRIGIHVGTVVRGVVGSQSPRFCVLGDASAIAEHLEAHAAPNTVSCSVAARAAYLSSGYSFTPSEDIIDASPQAPFPPGNLRAATGRGGNGHNGRRLSAPSLVLSQRRVVGFANDAFARSNGGTATVQVRNETHWQQPEAQESSPFTVTGLLPSAPQWQMTGQSWAIHQPAAFIVQAAASADAAMIT